MPEPQVSAHVVVARGGRGLLRRRLTMPDVDDEGDDDQAQVPAVAIWPGYPNPWQFDLFLPCPFFHV